MLAWHRRLWLIDHGATLYVHHTRRDPAAHARRPFERIRDHVLLPFAGLLRAADDRLAHRLTGDVLASIVRLIPAEWLRSADAAAGDLDADREAYVTYLAARLREPRSFVEEADRARAS